MEVLVLLLLTWLLACLMLMCCAHKLNVAKKGQALNMFLNC